jgi:hypothetical protein
MGGGGSALGGATVGGYGDGGAGIVSLTVLFMYATVVGQLCFLAQAHNVTGMVHSCTCHHLWQCFWGLRQMLEVSAPLETHQVAILHAHRWHVRRH